jgi:hypothetical protein
MVATQVHRPLSVQSNSNRTGTIDSYAMTNQLNSNYQMAVRLGGSSVKSSSMKSHLAPTAHFRSIQATPSIHAKSVSISSVNAPPNSVQKSCLIQSSRLIPIDSISPPSDVPLCKIFPRELVNKMKELQSCKTADEVEDEEDEDDDDYRILEEDEDEEEEDLNETLNKNCTVGSIVERAPTNQARLTSVQDSKTLSVLRKGAAPTQPSQVPKVKFGFNALRRVMDEKNGKTAKEVQQGKSTATANNNQVLVDKYRKIITKKEPNRERVKERDQLRQAKSEPDLYSMDLSSAVSHLL